MQKPSVFLVDPRIDFRNIYALNLIVYINADVLVFETIDALITGIKTTKPDVVYMNINPKDEDKLFNYSLEFKQAPKKPITIVQTKNKKEASEDFIFHDSDILVKDFVQLIARNLGITAKYMAEIDFGHYFPLPVSLILPGWQMTQSVFLKSASGVMTPFLEANEFLKNKDLEKIKNADYIYCKSNYRLEVVNSFTSKMKSLLDSKTLTPAERMNNTETAFEMISTAIGNIGLPDTTRDLVKSTVSSMETLIVAAPTLSKFYQLIQENSQSLRYKKALICCHIGQFLLSKETWSSRKHVEQWTYLCFFHDIFLEEDSWIFYDTDEAVNKSELPARSKSLILNHARMSAQIISQTKELPVGIDVLVKQHHGTKMGDSISKMTMSISQTSIYFLLVEEYVKFFLKDNESKKAPKEIDDFIESLFKKYPFPNYKKFIPVLRSIPVNT